MPSPARNTSPDPAAMVTVRVARDAPTEIESLRGQEWRVPASISPGQRLRWIESSHREAAARAAAAAEAERRQASVLADRQQQILAAEAAEADALREQVAALEGRLAQLEAGANVDFAALSNTSASLAASLASTTAVSEKLSGRGRKAAETAEQLGAQLQRAEQLLQELQQERREFVTRINDMANAHFVSLGQQKRELLDEVRSLTGLPPMQDPQG